MTELEVKSIRSPTEFMKEIEKIVQEKNADYIDAVVLYCQANNIEIETAASLVKGSTKMKAKIQNEAEDLNYLPKTRKLPI